MPRLETSLPRFMHQAVWPPFYMDDLLLQSRDHSLQIVKIGLKKKR